MSNITDTTQLGALLRQARKQLGLTQPELALTSGVGVRFIVDLEAGKPTVQLALTLRVIDALGGELSLIGLPEPDEQADSPTSLSNKAAPDSTGKPGK